MSQLFGTLVLRRFRMLKPCARQSVNQSINKFITRHSTEARATMSLSQTEKERLESILENVNGWSSPTAQWKRVPESWCRDRETTISNVDVVRGGTERRLCVDDRTRLIMWADQMSKVDRLMTRNRQIAEIVSRGSHKIWGTLGPVLLRWGMFDP